MFLFPVSNHLSSLLLLSPVSLITALSFLEQFYKILVQILIRRRCLQHNIKSKT